MRRPKIMYIFVWKYGVDLLFLIPVATNIYSTLVVQPDYSTL